LPGKRPPSATLRYPCSAAALPARQCAGVRACDETFSLVAAIVTFTLSHNHPSGVAEPSQADELITTRLREALALIDVRVLDHLIVAAGDVTSFAERGLLQGASAHWRVALHGRYCVTYLRRPAAAA